MLTVFCFYIFGSSSNKQKSKIYIFNIHLPAVLKPGVAVNRATSTIFTANGCADSRWIHRRTIENGPLKKKRRGKKCML